jgi:Na+/melibiose symporter-like transporter
MRMLKSVAIIISPAVFLVALGFILHWHFAWIIVAYCAGIGIGFLALLTWVQVRDNSDKPNIKIEKDENSI